MNKVDALFDELIHHIYEAAYDESHWAVTLERLVGLSGSRVANILYYDTRGPAIQVNQNFGTPPELLDDYHRRFAATDPGKEVLQRAPVGSAVSADRIFDPARFAELCRTEFYESFMAPQDIHYGGGLKVFDDQGRISALSFFRSRAAGTYDDATLELISALTPHLQRALRIHREFVHLKAERQALLAGFDQLVMGLILFDARGEVLYRNPMAERILAHHPALTASGSTIAATHPGERIRLRRLIRQAVETDPGDTVAGAVALGLHHPDGVNPLPILIRPLDGPFRGQGEARAALFLSDPEQSLPLSPDVVSTAYGLSETEARVAVGIANSLSVKEIAGLHGVSHNTVRTQLKTIFQKLGISRQTELVKLLLSGPFAAA